MATAIYQKQDALKKFNNSKVADIGFFTEDKNTSGAKKFYVTKPQVIYDSIVDCKSSQSHYYESWSETSKILYSQDIDIGLNSTEKADRPVVNNREDALKVVKHNITSVIKAFKTYYDVDYDVDNIIVLESEPEVSVKESKKYSYHVIYRGIVFQNHLVCKDFHIKADSDFNMHYTDVSIYGKSCLRLCYCCKAGKKAILLPLEMNINGKKTLTDTNTKMDHFQFFIRTLITTILPSDEYSIKKSQMFVKPKPEPTEVLDIPKNSIENINLEEILFQLPFDICDEHNSWRNVGMALYNADETGSLFDLWDRWSQQSSKYKPWEMKKKWNSFSGGSMSLGYIINLCKRAGISNIFKNNKASFTEIINNYPTNPINLNQDSKTVIVDVNKLEPSILSPHIHNKLLAIQSEKGTGKTFNLLQTLFETEKVVDENTSILFVSSRRTFGAKLYGDLKKYGFILYSETKTDIYDKKVICQIDSLLRIQVEKFDYVIVDESESLARYLTSKHFTKNPKANRLVDKLEEFVEEASKVVIMDADLSNRCMEYYKNVTHVSDNDTQLIINIHKPFTEYKMVCMKYDDWVQKILEDVNRGLKIAVPMASNNKAKDLKIKIEMDNPDIKVLLIHSETKDADKVTKLMHVNETWQEYDVVIYSPSVCMGVSFDIPEYFDSIYAYGCENSVGAQEFAQMLHRIREPTNKIIYLSLNIYKEFDTIEDTLSFEQVEDIITSDYQLTHYDLHQNVVKMKNSRITDEDGNSERVNNYPYKDEPVYRLFVHNALESILNTQNFGASFFGYIKAKGYEIDFFAYSNIERDGALKGEMKDIRNGREMVDNEERIQGIIDAPDITKDEFVELIKQRDECLEPEDIHKIKRYGFKVCYGLDNDTDMTFDFVDEYNTKDKMKWYHNMSHIMQTDEQDTGDKLGILKDNIIGAKWMNSCYMDFTFKNTYTNHLYATNIIKHAGFDINNLDSIKSRTELEKSLPSCMQYFDSNKENISYKFNLKMYNKNFDGLVIKEQIKIINSVLGNYYGLKIKRITPYKKDKTDHHIWYQLSDSKIWDSMPREDKIIPVDIQPTKQYEENMRDQESLINFMDEDDEF